MQGTAVIVGVLVLVGLLLAALIVQSFVHRQERKELYNRIMSRDLADYQSSKGIDKPKKTNTDGNNTLYKRMKRAYRGMYGDIE